jgi:hypothetical protein
MNKIVKAMRPKKMKVISSTVIRDFSQLELWEACLKEEVVPTTPVFPRVSNKKRNNNVIIFS